MTVLLTDGPLVLEGTHRFTPAVGSALTMNVLHDTSGHNVMPRIRFDRMAGFRSLPDADDNRSQLTARIGEHVLPSLARGKSYTIEGRIQARNMPELRQQQMALMAVFAERNGEGVWSHVPNATWGDTSAYWTSRARVIGLDIDTDIAPTLDSPLGRYQAAFTASMRMSDPRFYWSAAASASGASSAACTNQGNAPTDPTVTVTGASGAVTIARAAGAYALVFAGLPAGTLVVNFAARTALIGSADAIPYLNVAASNWWDRLVDGLPAGASTVTASAGSGVAVGWQHACW